MAGIDAHPAGEGGFSCFYIGANGLRAILFITSCIRLCIQFNPIRPGRGSALYHTRISINKNGNPATPFFNFADDVRKKEAMLVCIPTGIGGKHVRPIGHQRCLGRLHFADDLHITFIRVTLNVEFSGYHPV